MPQDKAKPNRAFNRLLAGSRAPVESNVSPRSENHLDSSISGDDSYDSDVDDGDSSSDESGTYVCGFLDAPIDTIWITFLSIYVESPNHLLTVVL